MQAALRAKLKSANEIENHVLDLQPLPFREKPCLVGANTHTSQGGVSLTNKPPRTRTPAVPPERRAGIYERDEDVTGLLRYGTDSILEVPKGRLRTTAGTARDRHLVLEGEGISAHHFVIERRARSLVVTDDASTNGLAYESKRDLWLGLKPSFDDKRDNGDGFEVKAGMSFLVGTEPNRFIALDDAMREHYPALVAILGREDEFRGATEGNETPAPSDLILAADGPGHLLITGEAGCDQEELARIIHKISKRRGQPLVEIDHVPDDRRGQNAVMKQATRGTLVLDLGVNRKRLDPAFVSAMFSPDLQLRVIAIARTPLQARRVLGHQHWRPLMHIELRPLSARRGAILRLLDQCLVAAGSVLRVSDLTPPNQRALLYNPWRENLQALRGAAVRLDAIVRMKFSRRKAAESLGIVAQTFYHWFGNTMKLTRPLVTDARRPALAVALAVRTRGDS